MEDEVSIVDLPSRMGTQRKWSSALTFANASASALNSLLIPSSLAFVCTRACTVPASL